MEHSCLSLPYLLTYLPLLLVSVLLIKKQLSRSKTKLPPGPWTLPLIGSLHHFANASLPHRALHNLALVHGPVMLLRAGEIDIVVLTSREAAKEVLKTQDAKLAIRSEGIVGNILFYGCTDIVFSNGPYWRQMRRICASELLSPKRVKSFSSIRQQEINSLLKTFSINPENSPINLSEKMRELSNNITIRSAFGGMSKNRRIFLEGLREILEYLSGFTFSELFPSLSWLNVKINRRLVRLRNKINLVMEEVLQEHLKQRKNGDEKLEYDLVDVLINSMESGDLEEPITRDHIKAIILDLFTGGTESSATVIIWAMTELIRNPEIMAKVQAEIKQISTENRKLDHNAHNYMKLVIKETLRMHPVGPILLPRFCKESCEVLGYTIPSNARLLVNAWSLGRNPDYWNEPEIFKPERFETSDMDVKGQHFEFLPFGSGRRICPGLEYGMALVEETLVSLLSHFDWKLPAGVKPEDLDMTETFGSAASKKEPLYLIPTLRVPLHDV